MAGIVMTGFRVAGAVRLINGKGAFFIAARVEGFRKCRIHLTRCGIDDAVTVLEAFSPAISRCGQARMPDDKRGFRYGRVVAVGQIDAVLRREGDGPAIHRGVGAGGKNRKCRFSCARRHGFRHSGCQGLWRHHDETCSGGNLPTGR